MRSERVALTEFGMQGRKRLDIMVREPGSYERLLSYDPRIGLEFP